MDVYGIEALLGLPEFRVVDQVIRLSLYKLSGGELLTFSKEVYELTGLARFCYGTTRKFPKSKRFMRRSLSVSHFQFYMPATGTTIRAARTVSAPKAGDLGDGRAVEADRPMVELAHVQALETRDL